MIFCEICEIFKNTFFYRTPPVAASEKRIAEQVQWFNGYFLEKSF